MTDPTKDNKRVCPQGQALGRQMAAIADKAYAALDARLGEGDERCKSCAFTRGTVPNGCLQTQMDVIKAVIETAPFMCHQHDRKGAPCDGWYAVYLAMRSTENTKGPFEVQTCPWEFSPPDRNESTQGEAA